MLEEKIMERQVKAIKKAGKGMRTVDFVKDGYHYFGNGFQIVKVAITKGDENAEQFEVVRSIFDGVEKYKNSVSINLYDLWCVFKGLKSSNLCENGVALNFDGNGNLTIENDQNKFIPKIKIRMDYEGDGTKYNVLLFVNHIYDILNVLISLGGERNIVKMFFDPSKDLSPVLFCGSGVNDYEVVQPVMRKF